MGTPLLVVLQRSQLENPYFGGSRKKKRDTSASDAQNN